MKKFTLIELLVVIVIIAILISLLMPSLSKARYKAKKVTHMGNMKQISLGMIVYAKDNDMTMPQFIEISYLSVNTGHDRETNAFMYNQSGAVQYDWRDTLTNYGIMPSTVNVITNLPAFDDPGNTHASYLRMSWTYQVGNNYATYGDVVSPQKLNLGNGSNVILSDWLRQNPSGVYFGTFGSGGDRRTGADSGEASRGFKYGITPEGSFATHFDGSVQWYVKGDMDFWHRSNGFYHWFVPNE